MNKITDGSKKEFSDCESINSAADDKEDQLSSST